VVPPAARAAFSRTAIEESDGYYAAFKAKLCERLIDATGKPIFAPGALSGGSSGLAAPAAVGGAAVAGELRALREEIAALRHDLEVGGGGRCFKHARADTTHALY
jgi:hypothetical protein